MIQQYFGIVEQSYGIVLDQNGIVVLENLVISNEECLYNVDLYVVVLILKIINGIVIEN